jgi:hypothetical protein
VPKGSEFAEEEQHVEGSVSNLEILQALVFEPRKAFAELGERPRFWFPLLLLIVSLGAIYYWYTSVVDLAWATDQQIRNSALMRNSMTEEQIAQAVQRAGAPGQNGMRAVFSVIGVAFGLPIGMLLAALFYLLIAKMTGFDRSYRHWFSYCCWVSVPLAIGAIPAAVVLATTETAQFTQESLKALSLNALVFHRVPGEPGYSFFSNLDLFGFASLYLSLIAVKVWSGRSWLFASLFVGIPWGLIYGLWAFFSLR